MRQFLLVTILILSLSCVYAYRAALSDTALNRYEMERSQICFYGNDGIFTGNNTFTGNTTFYNVTILNYSIMDVNGSICLNATCIEDWDEVNGTVGNFVPYEGATENVSLFDKNLSFNNGLIYFNETTGVKRLLAVNPLGSDAFVMEYNYNFEVPFDDWLVFRKTDGNDESPDGGIAFVMTNKDGNNITVLKLDGYSNANFTNSTIWTTTNLSVDGTIGNVTHRYTWDDLNKSFNNGSILINISNMNTTLWINATNQQEQINNNNYSIRQNITSLNNSLEQYIKNNTDLDYYGKLAKLDVIDGIEPGWGTNSLVRIMSYPSFDLSSSRYGIYTYISADNSCNAVNCELGGINGGVAVASGQIVGNIEGGGYQAVLENAIVGSAIDPRNVVGARQGINLQGGQVYGSVIGDYIILDGESSVVHIYQDYIGLLIGGRDHATTVDGNIIMLKFINTPLVGIGTITPDYDIYSSTGAKSLFSGDIQIDTETPLWITPNGNDLLVQGSGEFQSGIYTTVGNFSNISTSNITSEYFCNTTSCESLKSIMNKSSSVDLTGYAKYQYGNESFNGSGNYNSTDGNITLTNGYFVGQPITGSIGSGIIWINNTNRFSELNISCVGLVCSYDGFKARIVSLNNTVYFCDIPKGSYTVTNTRHNILYIDNSCVVKNTDWYTYYYTSLGINGTVDFGNMVTYGGASEVINGLALENKRIKKIRLLQIVTQGTTWSHLSYISGMDLVLDSFRNFTISSGSYIYLMDTVPTSRQNTTTTYLEVVSHSGVGTWQHIDQQGGLNLTSCDTGASTITCTNDNRYRQYPIFIIGYNESDIDYTGLHQLLASESTTYATLSDCLSAKETFTFPNYYQYSARLLYVYCGRASDSSWVSTNWIDKRNSGLVFSGASAGVDISNFVTTDGTTQMLGNWDAGAYNISVGDRLNATTINSTYGQFTNLTVGRLKTFDNGSAIIEQVS